MSEKIYKNSVLYKPIESISYFNKLSVSSGISILAFTFISIPSFVIAFSLISIIDCSLYLFMFSVNIV